MQTVIYRYSRTQAPPLPSSVPWSDGDRNLGTLIMTPVAEGYECRWYKLPASLPPGTGTVPIDALEYVFGGLYGKDRNLIREL
jgi:hypothetical protein